MVAIVLGQSAALRVCEFVDGNRRDGGRHANQSRVSAVASTHYYQRRIAAEVHVNEQRVYLPQSCERRRENFIIANLIIAKPDVKGPSTERASA